MSSTSTTSPMSTIMRSTCLIAFAHTEHHSGRKKIIRDIYANAIPPYQPRWSRESPEEGPHLARISPLPSKKSVIPFVKSKPLTSHPRRRASPLSGAPSGILKSLVRKARGNTVKERPTILHLQDGRRVPMDDWLHFKVEPYQYTLIPLKEAQKRKDIKYRFHRVGQLTRVEADEWGRVTSSEAGAEEN